MFTAFSVSLMNANVNSLIGCHTVSSLSTEHLLQNLGIGILGDLLQSLLLSNGIVQRCVHLHVSDRQ